MDGLHLAAAIIHFIDYAGRLFAPGQSKQNSSNNIPLEHRELGSIAQCLLSSNRHIDESLPAQHHRPANNNIILLQSQIASGCQRLAEELLDAIEALQGAGPRTRWRSFRHALRIAVNDSKVHHLDRRLDSLRHQSVVNTLDNLRLEAARFGRFQATLRHTYDETQESQQHGISVGDRFIHDNELGETWRQLIVQSILENQRNPTAILPPFLGLKPKSTWARAYENGVRDRVLYQLRFRNMDDRERQIAMPQDGTFSWVFRDPNITDKPWSSFRDFLRWPTSKIYWITGKPGCGKSALIKYIRHSPETRNLLRQWSGGGNVLQAAFYFCDSGEAIQMSIEGLLQTLLLHCLRPIPSSIIQRVLPARWEVACLFDQDDVPWSWEELLDALRTLLAGVYAHHKFFILIDGLDEFSGERSQLIDLIMELAEDTENLKLCVASRRWPAFEEAFVGRPHLTLDELTHVDIDQYVESKFEENVAFCQLRQREPDNFERLISEVSGKAEGVFLWAQLAVQYLVDALSNGDMVGDIEIRLAHLVPGDLESLLGKMLESLDEEEREHASRIFQTVRACDDFPTVLCLALADLEDERLAKMSAVKVMPIHYKESLSRAMKRTIMSRCQGLLKVPALRGEEDDSDESDEETGNNTDIETDQEGGSDGSSVQGTVMKSISHIQITYLHRVVRDYVEAPHTWEWILSMSSVRFDPNLSLCKSNLLQFKGLDPLSLTVSEFWFHAQMSIKYAVRCMKVEGNVREVVELLDEVNKTGSALTYHYTNPTFVDQPGSLGEDDHWTSFFLPNISHPQFAHLMAACGVHQYLSRRLRRSDVGSDGLIGDQTPLLITSVQEFADLFSCNELPGPHPEVVEVLMRKGADCLQLYRGRSALSLVRRARKIDKQNPVYEEILRVFEQLSRRPLLAPVHAGPSTALARRDSQLRTYPDSDSESLSSTDGLCEGQNGREQNEAERSALQPFTTIHIQGRNIIMRGGNERSDPGVRHHGSSDRSSWSHYSHSLHSRGGEMSRVGQSSAFHTPRSLPAWDEQQPYGSQLVPRLQHDYSLSSYGSNDSIRPSRVATLRRRPYYPARFYSNPYLTPQRSIL